MARTKDSPSYITTTIEKLLELGIDSKQPINIRRLDIQKYVTKNLETLLTVTPKDDTVEDQTKVEEFKFDS